MLDELRRLIPRIAVRRLAKRRARHHGIPFVEAEHAYPKMMTLSESAYDNALLVAVDPRPLPDELFDTGGQTNT